MAANSVEPPNQLGNYDLLYKIAEGGMGAVYKGRHRITGDIVAVKVIAANTAKNPVLLQRFEREFQAAKMLEHPNVVRGIEYCGTGPYPYLVMEFVEGESLGQKIDREGAMPEAEAVRMISQVCDGLQRAHKQGLVHRDVKPDNILLNREGVCKLTDLGLVKDTEDNLNLTKTGRGLGTPHFMAPEQFRDAKKVDARGDIYSLGATLYTMLTGEVPFSNSNPLDCWMKKIRNEFPAPRQLNAAVSERVDWAVRRSMSADPDKRPSSCREFLEDLTGQGRGSGPQAQPAATATELWYMVYQDDVGQKHTVKGQTDGIRRALQDGLLGDASNILVSRTKTGQFVPLQSTPEFRDLVVAPAPVSSTRSSASSAVATSPRTGDSGVRSSGGSDAKSASKSDKGSSPRTSPAAGTPRPTSGSGPVPYVIGGAAPASPPPLSDPGAETKPHAKTPVYVPPAKPGSRDQAAPGKKKSFDWAPVLLIVVALLSAVVAYLLFVAR